MKKILIVNFKRYGDVFSTAHLTSALKNDDPSCNISLLVFKEFESAAKNINSVDEIFCLDRHKILTFSKNQIFSDAFAINEFFQAIAPIKNENWDVVINFSNDRVATHLVSGLNARKTVGVSFDSSCQVRMSNEWSLLFNEVLTTEKYSPITFTDCYRHMAGASAHVDQLKLKTHDRYNQLASENFKKIRAQNDEDTRFIGIQFSASQKDKSLTHQNIVRLIDLFIEKDSTLPILLVAPTQDERQAASIINEEFNNSLITIEADFNAINSIMPHLDLVITPDTAIKHVADLMGTPVLEVSLGPSPFFKQGTTNLKSAILTPNISYRVFSDKRYEARKAELSGLNSLITADDIAQTALWLLGDISIEECSINAGVAIYQPKQDVLGRRMTFVKGTARPEIEISRIIKRQSLIAHFFNQEDDRLYDDMKALKTIRPAIELQEWKNQLTESGRALLNAIRAIIQFQSGNEQSLAQVFLALEQLYQYSATERIDSTILKLFKGKVESIKGANNKENLKEVEAFLYELKSDIQKTFNILKSVEERFAPADTISQRREIRA